MQDKKYSPPTHVASLGAVHLVLDVPESLAILEIRKVEEQEQSWLVGGGSKLPVAGSWSWESYEHSCFELSVQEQPVELYIFENATRSVATSSLP